MFQYNISMKICLKINVQSFAFLLLEQSIFYKVIVFKNIVTPKVLFIHSFCSEIHHLTQL